MARGGANSSSCQAGFMPTLISQYSLRASWNMLPTVGKSRASNDALLSRTTTMHNIGANRHFRTVIVHCGAGAKKCHRMVQSAR